MNAIASLLVSVFRNADVATWFRVLIELVDFMVKAAAAYRETEEGQREWDDFASRYEVAVNNDANDTVSYSVRVQSADNPSQGPARVDDPNGGRK